MHEKEIDFHVFLQWLAHKAMQDVQGNDRAAGLPIGLITDLAIGTDPRGSHPWRRQNDLLAGVSVGAPPDLYQALGQDGGLTAMSPRPLTEPNHPACSDTLPQACHPATGGGVDHVPVLARGLG